MLRARLAHAEDRPGYSQTVITVTDLGSSMFVLVNGRTRRLPKAALAWRDSSRRPMPVGDQITACFDSLTGQQDMRDGHPAELGAAEVAQPRFSRLGGFKVRKRIDRMLEVQVRLNNGSCEGPEGPPIRDHFCAGGPMGPSGVL